MQSRWKPISRRNGRASKFVKGDAIVGIIITVINIVGGLIIGSASGMPFNQVLQRYTILTIGDGLVSQIPALLIYVTGIIVTRAASESNLGRICISRYVSRLFGPGSVFLFVMGFLPVSPVAVVFYIPGAGLSGLYFAAAVQGAAACRG